MRSKKRRGLTVSIIAAVFAIAGYTLWNWVDSIKMPEPTPLAVWLPSDAIVRPDYAISPGTFSISLSLEKFKKTFPSGGIVSYPEDVYQYQQFIVVWKYDHANAVFFTLKQQVQEPENWPYQVRISSLSYDGNSLLAHPKKGHNYILPIMAYILSFGFGLVGTIFLFRR